MSLLLARRTPSHLTHALRQQPLPFFRMTARTQSTLSSFLVSPSQLNAALNSNAPSHISSAARTIPLCASWFLPNDPDQRTGRQVFRQTHIPSARFFDLDKISDTASPYPHMLPSAATFAAAMENMGIHRDDAVVVYDSAELGIFSAPRVAWTLSVFGHPRVHVLNNFRLWLEQGFPVREGAEEQWEKTSYPEPKPDLRRVVAFNEVREMAKDVGKEGAEPVQILDARSHGRWAGTDPEPRPGLSSGHIPGSISVPVPDLLDPKTKTLLPAEQLRAVFEGKGVDPRRPIISSCGTGVTATIIDAALAEAGYGSPGERRVYDGSWTEWAMRVKPTDNLIVKG
ncbi:hypothetical protein LTR28_002611 [Elasticomyces elasticus]|nr:hypothetical protein LTR28_002611 [Elasticomyces elasticus]